jgi:hypothetical protein
LFAALELLLELESSPQATSRDIAAMGAIATNFLISIKHLFLVFVKINLRIFFDYVNITGMLRK